MQHVKRFRHRRHEYFRLTRNRRRDYHWRMKTSDALDYFKGNVSALTRFLGLKQNAFYSWRGNTLPPIQQIRLEALTKGELRADDDAWHPAPPRFPKPKGRK